MKVDTESNLLRASYDTQDSFIFEEVYFDRCIKIENKRQVGGYFEVSVKDADQMEQYLPSNEAGNDTARFTIHCPKTKVTTRDYGFRPHTMIILQVEQIRSRCVTRLKLPKQDYKFYPNEFTEQIFEFEQNSNISKKYKVPH